MYFFLLQGKVTSRYSPEVRPKKGYFTSVAYSLFHLRSVIVSKLVLMIN